jgi:hypothetical protein
VRIDKDNTTIIDGAGKSDIQARVGQIKQQIEETTTRLRRELRNALPSSQRRRCYPRWRRDRWK